MILATIALLTAHIRGWHLVIARRRIGQAEFPELAPSVIVFTRLRNIYARAASAMLSAARSLATTSRPTRRAVTLRTTPLSSPRTA